jgi:hypothetical protein
MDEPTFTRMRDFLFPYIPVRRGTDLDLGLVHNTHLDFAPRLGVAYQLGKKTVLRGGYGIFYGFADIVSGSVLSLNPPSRVQLTQSSNTVDPTILINKSVFGSDPFRQTLVDPGFSLVRNPDVKPDLTQMFNFSVQHQFASNWLLEVGYMGNRASRVGVVANINDAIPALPNDTSAPRSRRRLTPNLGNLPFMDSIGYSNFNALTVGVEKRYARGLTLLANYTWSRALGAAPPVTEGINDTAVQNPVDIRREYGPLEFDVINRFTASYVYDLPFGRGRPFLSSATGVVKALTWGWQLNGITTLQGGLPFTPTLSNSLGKTFTNSRPNAIGDPAKTARQPYDWISPAAFAIPSSVEVAAGNFFGSAGRNSLREPGYVNFDFSVTKNFEIREQMRLQFRTELFNSSNTPFFGIPASVGVIFGSSTFGKVTAAGDPRIIQMALKLVF